jgi:glutamate synthase (NADPH/NADH) small chain
MGKVTGFLEYKRIDPSKRLPLDRLKDANEIRLPQSDDQVSVQGARCMNCGIPYCSSGVQLNGMTAGCPLHNLIPEWNDLVYKNQWEQAYRRLSRTNPFPEFTARVCPAPCEGSCTEGSILDPVAISSIEYQIIEKAFKEGWVLPKTYKPSGKKVAIVGSGPSGLSAASCLNALGHEVTVYERHDRVGGLLMYGIPNMKLDKGIVERRIDLMRQSGIHFIVNTEIGKDISARSLVDEYDAVILCGGATKARSIEIEGSTSKGIYFAVDFLKANTKRLLNKEAVSSLSASGEHVIILGGGDTGTDCVATSLRQSCLSVTQFEIMGEPSKERNPITNPWPEWPKKLKVDYGQEEAIAITGKDPREYLISAKKFIANDLGEVKEVHTIRVVWEKDSKGRFGPVEVANSEQVWKADLVLLAMGFIGPEPHIANELKLEVDPRTNYKADYGSFKTNIDKVFTAGDMRRGQSLVVWAIQEGKSVASEVDQFLLNKK